MNNLASLVLTLAANIAMTQANISANVRDAFNALPRVAPRRKFGRTAQVEREAFRLFVKYGISREEIAVKFAVSFQTVYAYTR